MLKSGFHPLEFYHGGDALAAVNGKRICNRKDGTLFWELTSIAPIRNAQGDITNCLAIKEDVTEQKRTEERLASSNSCVIAVL